MREETEAIRAHYDADPQKEWDRLKKNHPYEKYITVRMMERYIRPANTSSRRSTGRRSTR